MNFETKKIKRAYRDINNIMDDILSSTDMNLYKTYVTRFIDTINNNEVLNYILTPFFDIDVNDVICNTGFGIRLEFNIPANIDKQIAFVLQTLRNFSKKSGDQICMFLFNFYMHNTIEDNIYPFNSNIVKPVFREILFKISDLIEDIPKDKEEVEATYMTIINYGNYNSQNGQVANGNQITQTQNINSDDIFKEIIEKIKSDVNKDEQQELISLVKEMKDLKNKPGLKEKVDDFISKTAKYSTTFLDLWVKLNKLIPN